MDVAEARKEVLRGFLATNGGFAEVVKRFKLTQPQASYLSQLTAKDSTASFGEKSAKNWEGRLKMEEGTLVRPAATAPMATIDASVSPTGDHVAEPASSTFRPDVLVVVDRVQTIMLECKTAPARREAADALHRFALSPDSSIAKAELVDLLRRLTGRPAAGQPAQVAAGKQELLEQQAREAEARHGQQQRRPATKG